MQIPDPVGKGIVEKRETVKEEVVEEVVEENDGAAAAVSRLTKEELDRLTPRALRKYKTRIMLQDILDK